MLKIWTPNLKSILKFWLYISVWQFNWKFMFIGVRDSGIKWPFILNTQGSTSDAYMSLKENKFKYPFDYP